MSFDMAACWHPAPRLKKLGNLGEQPCVDRYGYLREARLGLGECGLAFLSEPKRGGRPQRRPVGFRRKSRISHVANLGRSYGYCHSACTARYAAFPTETRSAQGCSDSLAEVLGRTKFDRYLSLCERQQLMRLLTRIVDMPSIAHRFTDCHDPSDNKFLDLAVSGAPVSSSAAIEDLLELHPSYEIPILKPAAYLEAVEQAHRR